MFSTLISMFKKMSKDDIIKLIDELNRTNEYRDNMINLSSEIYNPNFLKINDDNIDDLLEHFELLRKDVISKDCYYFVYDGIIQTNFEYVTHSSSDLEYLLELDCTIVNKNLEIVDISNLESPRALDENKFISILYFNYSENSFKFIPKESILMRIFDSNGNEITDMIDDLESTNKYYFDYDYDNGELYYYRKNNDELFYSTFDLYLDYLGD